MKFSASSLLALFAASALALPEPVQEAQEHAPRCVANLPNCAGSTYVGDDNCHCSGQKKPCGNWKCGWDGPHSILNCGSQGSGCAWIN
ncbi:hypothetical protein INS49_009483 [Diaporthe citri]|uniref:uncharacterized protein n=1 Tax=Diaporthe citri TaxID=83186 RepID=UPI001C809C7C|nr:uncharacterized protein INS49_009483 [Diaporthe citri]KAG6361259.1 hypothetical protein INS49_009483 [Diaporthe citri]